jgi:hypothetical protein
MTHASERSPLAGVVDAPLFIVPRVLEGLRTYRAQAKFAGDPAAGPAVGLALDELVDTLLAGIEAHPTKFWVMRQFQDTLERVANQDARARAPLGDALEKLMALLGIDSSDGVLGFDRR